MTRIALIAGVAAVLLLAACGDDEGGDTESFVADADALCAERNEAVNAAYDEAFAGGGTGPGSPADAALEEHAAAEEELASGLAEIEAPSELENVYAEMVDLEEKEAELLAAADASFHDGNLEGMEADRALASHYQDESHAIARGLEMSDCAGLLSAEEEEAVTEAVEDALADEGASSVEIDELEGHSQYAEAEVLPSGGRYDNEALRVLMRTDENGDWELANLFPFGSGE